ncbi:GNAT family N-acetyltransferase [Sphingomonas sanguinis]|jgi:RimJ/RimL family protein N-acetyltransferase|uniref:GNAT family N-acetyltransferase n=1 Tax=Sphingomonas sanguinis TaxID=33051 RepID=A0A7Y7QS93_9SPHN|nr:GNAT family protein [Sphingomonas sanguinis]MBZ6380438.1 GNAT family N-acetyltransferase [Sphingomonas sanguinis]NNG51656.1 GNAT family N-acetyltransferase [Sphingomonas sanguinis]NNG52315.1 GNAT family N-acetyltransferase [Sphingomonas sanguinis]NVP29741.1 GNAT family N-acetyltransferase [Sphingomonas sanguinis]
MTVWTETPTLTGRHVTLRPFVEADMPALIDAAREGELWNIFYANVSMMKTPDRWLAAAIKERDVGRALLFTVETPEGDVVGTTRYMRMAPQHRRLEIGGTFYATRVQRTGVNTEAKRMLLTHAFDVMECQAIQIRTDALNKRSQAAIERLGAKRDGVLRGHQVTAEDRVRDTVVYSILRHEWPGVRANLDYLLGKHR